jgi:hypothetical protein
MGVDESQGVALGWNSNAPLGLNGGHTVGGANLVMTVGLDGGRRLSTNGATQ